MYLKFLPEGGTQGRNCQASSPTRWLKLALARMGLLLRSTALLRSPAASKGVGSTHGVSLAFFFRILRCKIFEIF